MKLTTIHLTVLCCVFATSAQAAVVSTASNGLTGTFTVSGTDLANNNQSTFSSISLTSGSALFSSSAGALVEGTMYPSGSAGDTDGLRTLTPSNGAVLVIALNTAFSPGGYDLSRIDTYTGSAGPAQPRVGQAYNVEFATVSTPSTYVALYSVFSTLDGNLDNGPEVRVSTVRDTGNQLLASGVANVRFTFFNVGNESMYREIDLIGTAVPEPATASLALLGLGGLMMRRRRTA